MTWFTDATSRQEILALQPDHQAHFNAMYNALWSLPHIPGDILELCRLRLAQMHDSDTEWQRSEFTINNAKRDQLSQWHRSPEFTDAERACLDLTEVYAMDPQAISDEQANAVKAHFGDVGLVSLVEALGLFFGLTRLSLIWNLSAEHLENT